MPKPKSKRKEGCLACRQRRPKCDKTCPKCRNCEKANRVCRGWSKPDTRSVDKTAVQLPERTISAPDEAVPAVSKHQTDIPAEVPTSREYPEAPTRSSSIICNKTSMAKMALSIDTTSPVISRGSQIVEGSISPFDLTSRQDSEPPNLGSCSPPDIHSRVSFQTLLEEANVRAIRARERDLNAPWIPSNPDYDSDTEEASSGYRSHLGSIEMEDLLDSSGDEGESSSPHVPGALERAVAVSESS